MPYPRYRPATARLPGGCRGPPGHPPTWLRGVCGQFWGVLDSSKSLQGFCGGFAMAIIVNNRDGSSACPRTWYRNWTRPWVLSLLVGVGVFVYVTVSVPCLGCCFAWNLGVYVYVCVRCICSSWPRRGGGGTSVTLDP